MGTTSWCILNAMLGVWTLSVDCRGGDHGHRRKRVNLL